MSTTAVYLALNFSYMPWPHTPAGWLLLGILTLAWVLLIPVLRKAIQRRAAFKHQDAELGMLMQESARFCARWPRQRLSSAPLTELMSEANRSERVVQLLKQRGANTQSDNGYITSQIAAAQGWLMTVYGAMDSAAERENRS
jgi:hypothetical protein